ncbi:vWA domain-containing protein [Vibrio tapetis]|uniref:von Willebrand factor, type A n=1 Tax=Vibrio tapetis subsp. tapetis TaxID=1671868 RepID=A0A2N8ZIN7_9VIBR|nr:VWA domain-containing protein [Vibrio tapetis]SON51770.1 von Willebrand factor, type A [Vibrio tapetis subsp. tapetis]
MMSELEWVHPMWFWLLPAPILVYWLFPTYKTRHVAAKVPFFSIIMGALANENKRNDQLKPKWWQRIILVASWVLIVAAMAKPSVLGEVQTRDLMGRDVMVILDLSDSMAEQDFETEDGRKISRLQAAKEVLSEFALSRDGDRLGLILFGDAAFVQTPFTADHQAWLTLLDETDVAMAGQSTFLGDAMGLAIKVFQQQEGAQQQLKTLEDPMHAVNEKVVIVLTDGNDTGSFVAPIDAAKVASAFDVRIHVVAMGDPQTVGESAIDMETIERIASQSGGQAFQALDNKALLNAYQVINTLEPKLYQSTSYQPRKEVHHYLMLTVVMLYLLAFSVSLLSQHWLAEQTNTSEDNADV